MTRRSSDLTLLLSLCLLGFALVAAPSAAEPAEEQAETRETEPAQEADTEAETASTAEAGAARALSPADPNACRPAYATLEDIMAAAVGALDPARASAASAIPEVTVEWREVPAGPESPETAEKTTEAEEPSRAD